MNEFCLDLHAGLKGKELNYCSNPEPENFAPFTNKLIYNPLSEIRTYNNFPQNFEETIVNFEAQSETTKNIAKTPSVVQLSNNIRYAKSNLKDKDLYYLNNRLNFLQKLKEHNNLIIKKELTCNITTILKKEGSIKIESSQNIILDKELKLSKTIYLTELEKGLKQKTKLKLRNEITNLHQIIPHYNFLIFPSNLKCNQIDDENAIQINLYYKGEYQYFSNFCRKSNFKQIISFLDEMAAILNLLSSSINQIIQLGFLNIFTSRNGKPKIIIFPNSFNNSEFGNKNELYIKPISNLEIYSQNDPKKYYCYFFGIIFLNCFFPSTLIKELLSINNPSKNKIADIYLKFYDYAISNQSNFHYEFIKPLFSLCFLFDTKTVYDISVIKDYFLPALKKYREDNEKGSMYNNLISGFNSNQNFNNILNLRDENNQKNEFKDQLKNPIEISRILNQESFDQNSNAISKNRIIPILKICPAQYLNIYHFRNPKKIQENKIESNNFISIAPKQDLKIQKYSDRIPLSPANYSIFRDYIVQIHKMSFPSYGIEPIVNSDMSQDIIDQKILNEFSEEGHVKFFEVLNFLKEHYEGIQTKFIKIIKQYEEVQAEFKKLLDEVSLKKNKKELINHLNEIASKSKDLVLSSKEIQEKIIIPENLFFKINNDLFQKKATRITIKALNNIFYLDLRELDLIDSKPDSKLLILVIKMNDLFNTIIINQYDFVKLIYEGRTKELGNSVQKEIFKKIKKLPYFYQFIFGILIQIIFQFQKIIFQNF